MAALAASAVFAAEADRIIFPAIAGAAAEPKGSGFAAGLNSLTLLVAAGLAAAGGWAVWRHRRASAIGGQAPALAVDETRPLGNRQYLVVASYAGQKFLLGVCPGRIDMLAPLSPAGPRPAGRP